MTLKVVLLGGEGIGPEVVEAAARVLSHVVADLELSRPAHGEATLASEGTAIPDATKRACEAADAALFGATWKYCGDVLRFLRWGLDTYANVRPAISRPGIPAVLAAAPKIDITIVRQNTEGEYPTREGDLAELSRRWPEFRDILGRPLPTEGAVAFRITTEEQCRRISAFALRAVEDRARHGRRPQVAIVTKQNVLRRTDGMFRDTAEAAMTAAGVEFRHLYVDDACRRLVAEPESFGVILTPNLFGDVMSDLAAELVGGLGLAPSACIGDRFAYFESVHGSAPDIAGRGVANPLATILSVAMLLDHTGHADAASAVDAAVNRLLVERRVLTPDLGGTATTHDVAAAVIALIG